MIARLALAAAAIALPYAPKSAGAHPMHTTLAEVSVDARRHTVRAIVRVFSDDLAKAIGARAPVSDGRAVAYATSALRLTYGSAPVPLTSCGVRAAGDLLWICLDGPIAGDGRGLAMRDAMLCELFSDQVNIVQVESASVKRSLLFTRGDRAKSLW